MKTYLPKYHSLHLVEMGGMKDAKHEELNVQNKNK